MKLLEEQSPMKQVSRGSSNLDDLDLNPLLEQNWLSENTNVKKETSICAWYFDEQIWKDIKSEIIKNKIIEYEYEV